MIMRLKKFIRMVPVLLGLFLLIFLCVHFLSRGYTSTYTVDNKFDVKEIYTKAEDKEHNNYYIEIKVDDLIFNYEFYYEFKNNNTIVNDVIYYNDDYKCVLPKLNDNLLVDMMCYKGNVLYNYQDIKGESEALDEFVDNLAEDYKLHNFTDNLDNALEHDKFKYYPKNIPDDMVVTFTTLRGITTINGDKVNNVELFDTDIYRRDLSAFAGHYYITANYQDHQNFRDFFVTDILTGKVKTLQAPDYISFDAYIQGVINDNVYLYDINNEKQYKINIDKSLITQVGNANTGIRYYDGSWSRITTIKAKNVALFKNTNEVNNAYAYLNKYGAKKSGFYYYYLKQDDKYLVYRSFVQNKKLKKYLFTINNYNDVSIVDDYIFYIDDDKIKMYSDYTGIKTLVEYRELSFNDNIFFSIYRK